MFNIYLGIYIVVALLVVYTGVTKLNGMNQSIGAGIFFFGALIIFFVFGTKWFGKGSPFSETPGQWPPTLNTCPDYLTFYSRKMSDGSTQDSCIDMIGVSKNGALKVFPKGGDAPTSDEYYFSLAAKNSSQSGRNQELCQRAIGMGLTWEGITNGESCITPAGPVAPSGGGGNGGGGCPAQ
jgi:hypothetical protein